MSVLLTGTRSWSEAVYEQEHHDDSDICLHSLFKCMLAVYVLIEIYTNQTGLETSMLKQVERTYYIGALYS